MDFSLSNDFSVTIIGVKESDKLCLAMIRALGNTYGPTDEPKGLLSRVQSQLKKVKAKLQPIFVSTLPELESDLKKAGALLIEEQGLIKN